MDATWGEAFLAELVHAFLGSCVMTALRRFDQIRKLGLAIHTYCSFFCMLGIVIHIMGG